MNFFLSYVQLLREFRDWRASFQLWRHPMRWRI